MGTLHTEDEVKNKVNLGMALVLNKCFPAIFNKDDGVNEDNHKLPNRNDHTYGKYVRGGSKKSYCDKTPKLLGESTHEAGTPVAQILN